VHRWRAGLVGRTVDRAVALATGNPQHVLVGFLAATLVMLTGFARLSVDTDPARLTTDDPGAASSLTVAFVGEQSLMTTPMIEAVSALHRDTRLIEGVVEDEVLSVATGIRGPIPSDRQSINDLAAGLAADPLGNVVVSRDRRTMVVLVPLQDDADAKAVKAELERLISADDELTTVESSVAGVRLAQQQVAENLYSQLIARVVIGWLVGFIAFIAIFRRLVLAAVGSALVAVAVLWVLAIASAFGATVLVSNSLAVIAALVLATVHIGRFLAAVHAHPETSPSPIKALTDVGLAQGKTALRVDAVLVVALVATAVAAPVFRSLALTIALALMVAWIMAVVAATAALAAIEPSYYAHANPEEGYDLVALLARTLPSFGVRRRDAVASILAVVVGAGAVGMVTIALDDNFLRWVPKSSSEVAAADTVNNKSIGTTSVTMTLEAQHSNQLISTRTLVSLEALEAAWDADPVIGPSMSYRKLVLGDSIAARRISFNTADGWNRLGSTLIADPPIAASVRVWLRDADGETVRRLIAVTNEQLKSSPLNFGVDIAWSGEGMNSLDWQREVVRDTTLRALAGLVVVMIGAILALRSWRWALIAGAPALVMFVATFGVLGWLDGVHGLASTAAGLLMMVVVLESGLYTCLCYKSAASSTWSPAAAASQLGSGEARALIAAAIVAGVSAVPLARADMLPNGRGGSFLIIATILGTALSLVLIPAAASGPPRNTAPISARR